MSASVTIVDRRTVLERILGQIERVLNSKYTFANNIDSTHPSEVTKQELLKQHSNYFCVTEPKAEDNRKKLLFWKIGTPPRTKVMFAINFVHGTSVINEQTTTTNIKIDTSYKYKIPAVSIANSLSEWGYNVRVEVIEDTSLPLK